MIPVLPICPATLLEVLAPTLGVLVLLLGAAAGLILREGGRSDRRR